MQDLRQTPQYAAYAKSLGWQVSKCQISTHKSQMFLKTFPLAGTVVKLQRPEGKVKLGVLKQLIEKYKIAVFCIEPLTETKPLYGLEYSKTTFLPPKTIVIDLTQSEDQLLKQMKSKTRYNIKIAQKRGVRVQESQDIEKFVKLWHKTSKDWGNWLPQKKEILGLFKAFKNEAKLLFAYHNNELVGGLLIIFSKDTAFYMYTGSTKRGKELFAPNLLSWEGIKIAKKLRRKYFDFEGIYDERYSKQTKNWKGFTKFKEGFGGKVVEFPKTLVYYKNPILKLLNI